MKRKKRKILLMKKIILQYKERLVDLVITLITEIILKKTMPRSCIEYYSKRKDKKGLFSFSVLGKCLFLIPLSLAKIFQKVSEASIL